MNSEEKLYNQIKNAAANRENQPVDVSEKVWGKVSDRLEQKTVIRRHNRWRLLAIAASVLLVGTLAFEWLKSNPKESKPQESVVIQEKPASAPQQESVTTSTETIPNTAIKPNAPQLLDKQLKTPSAVVVAAADDAVSETAPAASMPTTDKKTQAYETDPGKFHKRSFEAVGVRKNETAAEEVVEKAKDAKIVGSASAPLVVVDGKAITGKAARDIQSVQDGLQKADPNDEKEVTILKEPLYIIDGHYYSEQELFGPNPTSPYAPLNQQEIESVKVLQGEQAITNYGKRGEKGVVVIVTKNRKPAQKAK